MISIVTGKTAALYMRPPAPPYCLNLGSQQAMGLKAWMPLGEPNSAGYFDHAGKRLLTQTGTMPVKLGLDGGLCASNTASTSNYLSHATAFATATPLTLAIWFNVVNVTADHNLICVLKAASSGSNYDYFALFAYGTSAGDPLNANLARGSTFVDCNTTTGFSANRWHHGCAVYTHSTLRACFIDGGSKGTNTTSCVPANLDQTMLGIFSTSDLSGPINGSLMNGCIWDRALSDADVSALSYPSTRWELYYPLGRRMWSFPAAGAAPAAATNWRLPLLGVG